MPRPATRRSSRRNNPKNTSPECSTILEETSNRNFISSTPVKKKKSGDDPFGFSKIQNVKAEKPTSPPAEIEENDNKENENPQADDTTFKTPSNSPSNSVDDTSTPLLQKSPHKRKLPLGERTPLRQLNGRELMERMPKRRQLYKEKDLSPSPKKEERQKKHRRRNTPEEKEEDNNDVEFEIDYERVNELKSKFFQIDQYQLEEEDVSGSSSQ